MALPRRWRWVGRVALSAGAVLVLGTRWREDRYSCHLCRARKEIQTASLVLWPVSRHEAVSYPGPASAGHEHDWWRYSYHYSNGLGGCLGGGAGSKPYRYKDATIAP